jgi:hypothetical protein
MPPIPTPVPPVIPLPGAFDVPMPELAPPTFDMPKWEPIPIKSEDIPALNPKPKGKNTNQDEEEESGEKTELKKDEQTLNAVQEMMTFTPPLPPFMGYEAEVESQVKVVELPGGFEMPVPKQEILVTAVATAGAAAVASVGATMVAGNLFKEVVKIAKPLIKIILKKVTSLRGKPPAPTWARQRLESRQRIKDKRGWRDVS